MVIKSIFLKIKLILFCIIYSFFIYNLGFSLPNQKRIISLGPYITEGVYLLGAEDSLIGCTIYCKKPQEAENKEKVGGVIDVNLEKIITLRPDLVIATSLTNPKTIEKLRNLKIEVIKFSSPKNFEELCSQFLELGKIVNKEKEAEKIIENVSKKLFNIKERLKDLPKPKVFVQIGAKPLIIAGGDSFINDFIKFAGGINLAENTKTGVYSREEIFRKNPDVIIISTMGIRVEEEIIKWRKYKYLNVVKNGRIYIVDSYKLCSPTPISFIETVEELVDILHFKDKNAS